jgi:hypothetical protein
MKLSEAKLQSEIDKEKQSIEVDVDLFKLKLADNDK